MMFTTLPLVRSEIFEGKHADFYADGDNYFMTAEQLGNCLHYSNPIIAINKMVMRNEYLKSSEFSVVTKLVSTDGKAYDTRLFNEDGIYEIAFLSKTAVAQLFRAWVRKVLKELRQYKQQPKQLVTKNPLLESSIYHATELSKINSELITEHDLEIGHLKDRIHFLEEEVKAKPAQPKQPKPKTKTTTKKTPVYRFTDVKSLYDDINNNYQSLFTSKELNKKGGSPAVISKMVFRWFELSDIKLKGNKLHLQTNKYSNASNMDIHNITKAEKTIGEGGTATYKIYYEGGTEPIIFNAALKGRKIEF